MKYVVARTHHHLFPNVPGIVSHHSIKWIAPQGYQGYYHFIMAEDFAKIPHVIDECPDPEAAFTTVLMRTYMLNVMRMREQISDYQADQVVLGASTKKEGDFYERPLILYPWEITQQNVY